MSRAERRRFRKKKGKSQPTRRVLQEIAGSIAPASPWASVPGQLQLFLMAFARWLVRPAQSPGSLVSLSAYDLRVPVTACLVTGIGAPVGMLIYAATGAHRYFNPWYLAAMSIFAMLWLPLLLVLTRLLLALIGRLRPAFGATAQEYLIRHCAVALAGAPLLWVAYPLRAIWPRALHDPWLWLALPLSLFGFVRAYDHVARYIRAAHILPTFGFLLSAYWCGLYFNAGVAEALVRVLRI